MLQQGIHRASSLFEGIGKDGQEFLEATLVINHAG
jgi:hypothetical protein